VESGAEFIICHPFFLSRGRHVSEDIPQLMKEASISSNNIEFVITEPLGVQSNIVNLIDFTIQKALPL